jgi:hypothetical protein
MCANCAVAEAVPGVRRVDFFKATNKLATTPFSAQPAPKPVEKKEDCKPCQKRKKRRRKVAAQFKSHPRTIRRRSNADGQTVVWVYWEAGARTNELQYSMASVLENLTGFSNLVICGDRPSWWNGPFIPSPRVTRRMTQRSFGSARFQKWCDSIAKLWTIIESDLVTEDFLWMYDDTFIMKNYSFEAISKPVAQGTITRSLRPNNRNIWREVKRRTGADLRERGLPDWDYSTHHPVTYNKLKLVETINTFGLPQNPRLIESIYSNHHVKHKPARALNTFQYTRRVLPSWTPRDVPVINVGQFNDHIRTTLEAHIPNVTNRIAEISNG